VTVSSTEGRKAGVLIGFENRDEDESSRRGSIPLPSAGRVLDGFESVTYNHVH
jgi:hypothetical protein